MPEKPREVIIAACAAIAERLRGDGFAFSKSGPSLKRVRGDFTAEIWFQSDRHNIAGHRAAIWIHGGVSSRALAVWRRDHPSTWVRREGPQSGMVAGGQIGNLTNAPTWMEWDFAAPTTRSHQIEYAAEAIRTILLPFFALFECPIGGLDALIRFPLLSPAQTLEYALSRFGVEAAEAAGRLYLTDNPLIRASFEIALAKIKAGGLPHHRGDFGSDLAALAVVADLDLRMRS